MLDVIFRARHNKVPRVADLAFGDVCDGTEVFDEAVVRVHEGVTLTRADISVHGGPWVGGRLSRLFEKLGADPLPVDRGLVSPPRNSMGPAIYLEAHALLVAARSPVQVALALSAMSDRLAFELRSIRDAIGKDVDTPHAVAAMARLESLTRRAPFGIACVTPPIVALIGIPNAGKSTLFNAMCGADRALVSPMAGTTRDRLQSIVTLGDVALDVWDGAGIHESCDPVEREGVALMRRAVNEADILIAVFDGCRPIAEQHETLQSIKGRPVVAVVTKADMQTTPGLLTEIRKAGMDPVLTSHGDPASLQRLIARIVAISPFGLPCSTDQPIPFTPRQCDGIDTAYSAISVSDWKRAVIALEQVMLGES